MVLKPGMVFLPRRRSGSRHPDGLKTFVNEGVSSEVRDRVVRWMGDLAVVDCEEPSAFKYGVDTDEGWMLGIVEVPEVGLVGLENHVAVRPENRYGHDCVCEVYNSDVHPYFELEIHGPLLEIGPGRSHEIVAHQRLFDVDRRPESEAEVRRHLAIEGS